MTALTTRLHRHFLCPVKGMTDRLLLRPSAPAGSAGDQGLKINEIHSTSQGRASHCAWGRALYQGLVVARHFSSTFLTRQEGAPGLCPIAAHTSVTTWSFLSRVKAALVLISFLLPVNLLSSFRLRVCGRTAADHQWLLLPTGLSSGGCRPVLGEPGGHGGHLHLQTRCSRVEPGSWSCPSTFNSSSSPVSAGSRQQRAGGTSRGCPRRRCHACAAFPGPALTSDPPWGRVHLAQRRGGTRSCVRQALGSAPTGDHGCRQAV